VRSRSKVKGHGERRAGGQAGTCIIARECRLWSRSEPLLEKNKGREQCGEQKSVPIVWKKHKSKASATKALLAC
jgi:hypothetical protein